MRNEAKFILIKTKNLLDLNMILQEKFKPEQSSFSVKDVSQDVVGLLDLKAQFK